MNSIFSLRPSLFRSRNPLRNYNTDMDRLSTVKRAMEQALAGAVAERDGLKRRVELYHAQAANLLDNTAEFGARSDEDEASITQAERNAGEATQRVRDVSAQIEQLQKVLAEVEAMIAGLGPANAAEVALSG
jgi:chromosome segregation ATPase